ncbi:PIN domain nuclease [Embleya sp. NBC_00888]|uniref:PIN domain nuclease n=1 Tax=Embleya sp. NBC_00888 TaxID=2975960 RepID=UPI00386B9A6C|nr:PIN domain nuclease [Embleya sp. NBC_00888]
MIVADYLIDTSAVWRLLRDTDLVLPWHASIEAGLVGICTITELEVLRSARSPSEAADWDDWLGHAYLPYETDERDIRRARTVQQRLMHTGSHRAPGPSDLIIAATAERHRLALLHDDNDFEAIAKVTGQPLARVTGSLP